MNKKALNYLVGLAMLTAKLGAPIPEPKTYVCPFCGTEFTGFIKFCSKCKKQLIKRGTRDQFIDEVKQ